MTDYQDSEQRGLTADERAWLESLTRTVANLAAQLTMTQFRLRALANVAAAGGVVTGEAVAEELATLARAGAVDDLATNLGDELAALLDVDQLAADISQFLTFGK